MNQYLYSLTSQLVFYKGILFGFVLFIGIIEVVYIVWKRTTVNKAEIRTTGIGLLVLLFTNTASIVLFTNLNILVLFDEIKGYLPYSYRLSWAWWVAGLIIYEFFYWLHHYLAHKVRLLWCLHAPHHSPNHMNLFVGFNHSVLESLLIRPVFVNFFPLVLGINPVILIVCNILDTVWGCLLHISADTFNKKLGPFEYFFQTPDHHRVHHSSEPRYIDKNFCSITLLWDYVFGTHKVSEQSGVTKFGVTRQVDTSSFWDVHFGEIKLLWNDIVRAPTVKLKVLHLIMPPGWHYRHTQ
ncbi:sterol desaturase family protein [Spirosoma harenae]